VKVIVVFYPICLFVLFSNVSLNKVVYKNIQNVMHYIIISHFLDCMFNSGSWDLQLDQRHVKTNQHHAKYPGQKSCRHLDTQTHTYRANRSSWTTNV